MRKQVFNQGRWQTQRERCHIADEEPAPAGSDNTTVGRVILDLMKEWDRPEPDWLEELNSEWAAMAGELAARHTRVARCKDGTLTVFVDGAVMLSELKRYWRTQMLKKLQSRFGEDKVRNLLLQPDPGPDTTGNRG